MPNFDGGHYFLTTLAPIRVGAPADLPPEKRARYMSDADGDGNNDDDLSISFITRIQTALEQMPTALQSPATEEIGVPAPFAKSLRTHLCRFVVIEDAVFNGRTPDNPLLVSLGAREEPLQTGHVDQLPCAYLMFVADFDAVMEPGQRLPSTLTPQQQDEVRDHYLRNMWALGSAELMKIYQNCQAFDEDTIKTPDDFAAYMRRCQRDTWMSFNDYYLDMPKLPQLPVKAFAVAAGLPLLAFVWCLVAWLVGAGTVFGMPAGRTALIAAVVSAIAIYGIYKYIVDAGQKPWPAAPDGDLPSVLKGLYLQQRFSDFVVENQGASAADLHAAFGRFLTDHKPEDVLDPKTTQQPGVVRS